MLHNAIFAIVLGFLAICSSARNIRRSGTGFFHPKGNKPSIVSVGFANFTSEKVFGEWAFTASSQNTSTFKDVVQKDACAKLAAASSHFFTFHPAKKECDILTLTPNANVSIAFPSSGSKYVLQNLDTGNATTIQSGVDSLASCSTLCADPKNNCFVAVYNSQTRVCGSQQTSSDNRKHKGLSISGYVIPIQ